MADSGKIAKKIQVKGLVQGVGFRPFIYRIAHRFNLLGWVENRNDGVIIKAEGLPADLDCFIRVIREEAPVASNIHSLESKEEEVEDFVDFTIVKSENKSESITDISPDIAACDNCLSDMKTQPHRIDYPFINCTNCGPRFSIIKDLPYDRDKTTMKPFVMCEVCHSEYVDVLDRRFHAQPVACKNCGPEYELIHEGNKTTDIHAILKKLAMLLEEGKIIAIKGIGGFQIACDAQNEKAVKTLRERKIREGKPFAVMFSSIEKIKEFTHLYPAEEKSLTSWRRPIVIVREKKQLAASVSMGFKTIGAMLPYMPFHHLLFEHTSLTAIVLTSGNLSDEPIVIQNTDAEKQLSRVADAILVYNREIYNRTDDSVAFVVNEKERILRRSRSYSPEPVNLNLNVDGIFAAGAELVNCFCIGKEKQAILSQHIGDLKNLETLEFYTESFERFKRLFRMEPKLAVQDMHPDYLSTQFALDLGIPTLAVQHHHAHIASCMAEHGLDEKVIGVSMDGTGYGDDGHIWGSEFFICDLADYERINYFEYIPLPGGDKVTKEPWRTAVSSLYQYFGESFKEIEIPFIKNLDPQKTQFILQAIDKKINAPLSCSAGRLFDAVSALLNICTTTSFHAEAPMRLENIAAGTVEAAYPFDFGEVISFKSTFEEMIHDLEDQVPPSEISAKFHNTFVNSIFAVVSKARRETGLNKVVLSGGSFQNRYVLSRLENLLKREKFKIFTQDRIPANDGGIALGQLVIGAKRKDLLG